mmetsp:Transcript_1175/g.1825  ORF Transcript_1175/g.1825 Transcript_1175/m.1825 type:complete len:242 (-) Transcript_1175:80-805(-)
MRLTNALVGALAAKHSGSAFQGVVVESTAGDFESSHLYDLSSAQQRTGAFTGTKLFEVSDSSKEAFMEACQNQSDTAVAEQQNPDMIVWPELRIIAEAWQPGYNRSADPLVIPPFTGSTNVTLVNSVTDAIDLRSALKVLSDQPIWIYFYGVAFCQQFSPGPGQSVAGTTFFYENVLSTASTSGSGPSTPENETNADTPYVLYLNATGQRPTSRPTSAPSAASAHYMNVFVVFLAVWASTL